MNDRKKRGLEKEISKIIGTAILVEVKNERISQTASVHHVDLTKDGRYVDVTFSILDLKNNINKETMLEDLEKLKGFFRKKISSELELRHVPEVRVHLDETIEHGVKIAAILNDVIPK